MVIHEFFAVNSHQDALEVTQGLSTKQFHNIDPEDSKI